ncbi:hypothetical protein CEXT_527101 [Caerostris extrusa]|uniref:Uncharacterized protein n=1 Tax=Caerostris extrusa TaxID=172846 RepID=A0AAV4XGN1_CAEEX|nr:hypothetical protein CEXT_527101 [Caerostris extrusa]
MHVRQKSIAWRRFIVADSCTQVGVCFGEMENNPSFLETRENNVGEWRVNAQMDVHNRRQSRCWLSEMASHPPNTGEREKALIEF